MNKKLLALAIGAAVAMPVAALADGPTLYGKINVSLENDATDVPAPGTDSDQWNVVDNASRVGIKGSAETGVDGVKGIYLAEFGLEADGTGATPFDQRNIYVGLTGGFGTVLLGNLDTPTKSVQGKVDQFNDTSVDMANHVAGELRAPNVVAYASPKIADAVTVTVALWQGEGAPDGGAPAQPLEGIGDAVSASVVYDNEGLYLGLGLDKDTPVAAYSGTRVELVSAYADLARLVAGYSTDAFEVGFLYQTAEGTDTGATDEETTMLLSGAFKTGDWKFKAQFAETEGDDGVALLTTDETATMMGLGADYALGKSTTASAFYAVEELDVANTERTVISFGLEQKF